LVTKQETWLNLRSKEVERDLREKERENLKLKDDLKEIKEDVHKKTRLIEHLTNHLYDLKHPGGGRFTLYRWKMSMMDEKKDQWLQHMVSTHYRYKLMRKSLHQWRSYMVHSYKRAVDLQCKVIR
jgi:hypothetical protein